MPEQDLTAMIEQLRRMRAKPETSARDWYRIQAKAGERKAKVWIYDDIGWMGTSAKSFAAELKDLEVDDIELHLNSPGGDAWDGIAIYNSLRDHPAKVSVVVDGVAASAASVIAMAGDNVKMNRGTQMMIHDAWGLVIGNAKDMTDAAGIFDKLSDAMADIYARRAGGTVPDWREAMGAESWYSAQEAVDVGLADEVVEEPEGDKAEARYDLKAFAFAYAGRSEAPRPSNVPQPPVTPAEAARRIHAAAIRTTEQQEGAGQVDPAKIREALGLTADASDDEVKAAALAAFGSQPNPPEPDPEPDPTPPAPKPQADGTLTIDVAAWQEQQDRIRRLEAQASRQRAAERDQVIEQAVADGKFTPARRDHWARLWDADPEGTRTVIEGLAKNVVPVAELGYGTDAEADLDDEFRKFFPPEPARKGR